MYLFRRCGIRKKIVFRPIATRTDTMRPDATRCDPMRPAGSSHRVHRVLAGRHEKTRKNSKTRGFFLQRFGKLNLSSSLGRCGSFLFLFFGGGAKTGLTVAEALNQPKSRALLLFFYRRDFNSKNSSWISTSRSVDSTIFFETAKFWPLEAMSGKGERSLGSQLLLKKCRKRIFFYKDDQHTKLALKIPKKRVLKNRPNMGTIAEMA
jgi:hypothetical protein